MMALTNDVTSILTPNERIQYTQLKKQISISFESKSNQSGLPKFVSHITLVHSFICHNDNRDAIRGIVCGIQFGRGFILVNTNRLKKLLQRSKSCMNGCFQRLGYDPMRPSHDIISLFTQLMPNVNPLYFEIRQWCVRLVSENCLIFFPSYLPEKAVADFEPVRISQQLRKVNMSSNAIQFQSFSNANSSTNNISNVSNQTVVQNSDSYKFPNSMYYIYPNSVQPMLPSQPSPNQNVINSNANEEIKTDKPPNTETKEPIVNQDKKSENVQENDSLSIMYIHNLLN